LSTDYSIEMSSTLKPSGVVDIVDGGDFRDRQLEL
jgi:hypothetical protein